MHPEAYAFVRAVLTRHAPTAVLEIGSRDVNGGIRGLFPGARYLGIDVLEGPGVDVAADGGSYVPDFLPDCVVCCEVLEHTREAERIVRHMVDLVATGGLLIVTCAGPRRGAHSAFDGGPVRAGEFYQNITAAELEAWLSEVSTVYVSELGGDLQAWAIR
jgi:hypothetical protein